MAAGSLVTLPLGNTRLAGRFVHGTAGFVFAGLYTLAMVASGMDPLTSGLTVGLGTGSLHALLTSPILVWVVLEDHPIERIRRAGPGVGMGHLAGRMACGTMVGLAAGMSSIRDGAR